MAHRVVVGHVCVTLKSNRDESSGDNGTVNRVSMCCFKSNKTRLSPFKVVYNKVGHFAAHQETFSTRTRERTG